jgi:hypothetical protein
MVLQTDLDLINELFERAPRYKGRNPRMLNITDYVGKHILKHKRQEGHMSTKEFQECMEYLAINYFHNSDKYPIRLKKQYGELWKCH